MCPGVLEICSLRDVDAGSAGSRHSEDSAVPPSATLKDVFVVVGTFVACLVVTVVVAIGVIYALEVLGR
jgi:hypothetical protein